MNKNSGFGLIEIVIAISIISMALFSMFELSIFTLQKVQQSENNTQALFLAKEAIEVVRVLKDKNWTTNINNLISGNNYYPQISGNSWSLASGTETINIFNRRVVIENVSRDPISKNIEQIYNAVNNDPNTKKITATVSWQNQNITLATYITNILGN